MATTAVTSSTSSTTNTTSSTSSSSSTSSTSSTSATAKTAATNIVKSLGTGSGIDINSLAQSLVDAEQGPQRDAINAKISQAQSRITGYSALKYSLADLQTAFSALKDVSDFNSITSTNSQPSAFSVSASVGAIPGAYAVSVTQVALGQRSIASFAASNTPLDNADFSLSLKVGNTTKSATVTDHTPSGVVSAINGSSDFKALGVSAQLVDTGVANAADRYKVIITGATGSANGFSLTSTSATPITLTTPQSAVDAIFTVNGVQVTRPTNTVNDVVPGVTFNLYDATSGTARLGLNRDTSSVSSKVQALVTAYNTFVDSANVLGDAKSSVATYGGVLAGDSLLRSIQSQLRNMLVDNSSSPGSNIKALRDVGVSFDRYGKLQLTQSKLDSALNDHFDEVVTMFSANTENQSVYATSAGGVAGDVVRKIDGMLRSTGLLAIQTQSTQDQVTRYNGDLTALKDRMQRLLDNYIQQFSAMDSLVGQTNSLRTSLQSSFDGMMATYTKG